jgi:perosamine synthetase
VLAQNVRKIGGHGFKNLTAQEGQVRLNQDVFQNPSYKRHDVLGWNYRLPEVNAAIALGQLERLDLLVSQRIESAGLFLEVMKDNEMFRPQVVPNNRTHSYYTLGVQYTGKETFGIEWEEFRRSYMDHGGDGIYGSWSVPYLEPVIRDRKFVARYPEVYRDVELAKHKANSLRETIQHLSQ